MVFLHLETWFSSSVIELIPSFTRPLVKDGLALSVRSLQLRSNIVFGALSRTGLWMALTTECIFSFLVGSQKTQSRTRSHGQAN